MKLNRTLFYILAFFFIYAAQAESIKFNWPKIDDAILYEIEVYPAPQLSDRLKIEQVTRPSTKITSGPGVLYVRVRYKDEFGRWSDYSNLSAITIKPKKVPVVIVEEKPKPVEKKVVVTKPEPTPEPEPVLVASDPEVFTNWQTRLKLTPAYSTFNLKSDSVNRNESLILMLLGIEKKLGQFSLLGDFNFTAKDNGVRPSDYGASLSKLIFGNFSARIGAGRYSLTSDSNELDSDIKLYYYSLGLAYSKEISDKINLQISSTLKVGNPLTNKSLQFRAHLNYVPTFLPSKSYLDFFVGQETWSFESQGETLNTTQLLSGIGFIKQF